ncbi:hypothetical protein JD969_19095 [Planctomycetota bacterium]|nr:hypothetical protein JD969_19095 [Planctomycetota bacterium]
MAWTSMHFAVGMMGGGVAASLGSLILRRGVRWIPIGMTLGGVWALIPDLPRIWREDFTWLPGATFLGQKSLEQKLHAWGDIFFLHAKLDAQPHEFALHGLALVIGMYTLSSIGMMWYVKRQNNRLIKEMKALEQVALWRDRSKELSHRQHRTPDNHTDKKAG